ncbi:lipoprotein cytochrome c [Desulfuromonas sp. DDH964]|nr:lipoprotein cytochrome c [Desulfuromonas sp. DDH964]
MEKMNVGREVFFAKKNSQVNYRHMNRPSDNEVRTAMKDGIRRSAGMLRIAQLALVAVMALLFVFGVAGMSEAAVSVLESFANPAEITNTTTNNSTATYVPPAGTNRLVVLMVQAHTNNTTSTTITMTYGGQTATPAVNSANNQRRQVWIATLKESQLAAATDNTITISSNNIGSGYILHVATYGGVDQTTPVTASGNIYSGTTTVNNYNWSTAINVNAGGYGIVGSVASQTLTSLGANEAYTEYGETAVGTAYAGISDKAYATAGTTLPNLVSIANAYSGLAGITLNPYIVTDSTPPSVGTVTITSPAANTATYVPANVTFSAAITEPQSTPTCQYTTNGSTWSAGVISGASSPYTCTATVTGLTGAVTLNIRASSLGGGPTTGTALSRTVDATAPVTTAAPAAGTYTSDQNVTLTPSDAGVGVASTVYCVDATNTCTPGSNGLTFGTGTAVTVAGVADSNVVRYLRYASTDLFGAAETVKSATYNLNRAEAPTINTFSAPATVVDTAAPLVITPITFTATDNVGVTGYMITVDNATAPLATDAGWSPTAPTSVTVGAYATYTLRAYAKDAAGNVSAASTASVTVQNCVESGTVSVSISPDPGAGNIGISGVTVTANLGGGATNGLVRWRENGTAWSAWVASGATYTPTNKSTGTVDFEAMADGNCGATSPVYSTPLSRTFETRVPALEPTVQNAQQNGLTAIRVMLVYCNDLNGNGTFQVEYKLSTEPTIWTTAANTPTADGGAGDADGTRNETVVIDLTGLTTGATYDVRMTYIDGTDGVIGTAVYTTQVQLVAWADNPMLHNSLRFPGTTKHAGDWGTSTGYGGGFQCSTCHDKETGNVKRIKAQISFPDGSNMPNGALSATVSLQTVEDGSSDFGNDAGGHASSNKICEVCHSATSYHRNDTSGQTVTDHYNQADCIKCHQHKVGFKADCVSCHANPPINAGGLDSSVGTGSSTAGKHAYHVTTKGYGCNTCHTGWETSGEMPKNGNINVGFNIVLGTTTDTTGAYDGRSTGGGYTAAAGTSVTTGNGLSCSAIYCHGTDTPAWTDAGTAVCGTCHGTATGMPSATPGDGDLSGANSGSQVGKHFEHVDATRGNLPCSTCHLDRGFGTADHVNGTVDIWFDTTVAGTSATYNTNTNTCSNLSCHISKVWDTATPASCDMCHGYPPTPTTLHVTGATPVDHSAANIAGKHNECNLCHGYSLANGATDNTANGGDQYQVSYHRDGNIEMNGISAPDNSQSAQYDSGTAGCAKACHANDAAHQMTSSGLTVVTHEYGSGSCTGCHDGSGNPGDATTVNDNSPHALATTGLTCEECHGSHGGGTIEIPNNTIVGINYTANGEAGIALGVAVTAPGATEAEICWNCHSGAGVSEWGTNNNADGITYNYGTLNQSNWVGATWTSAVFSYKTGAIQSTHTANSAGTSAVSGANYAKTETLDAVSNIRCSYCHDVHDLNKLASDSSTGKPYLRGTWKGNPYNEDGAPRSGAAGTWLSVSFGGATNTVPRANAAANNSTTKGGYWIDQNSGDPNSTATLANSAGLCTLCHGSNVDTMDQTTGENLWVSGGNGHQNAVIGGSGTTATANNIFSIRKRGSNQVWDDNGSSNYYMSMGGWTPQMARRAYGYRGDAGSIAITPNLSGEHRYFSGFQWDNPPAGMALQVDDYTMAGNSTTTVGAITQSQYHTFNCGKCHNPHASRLPKLMITNCLDTKQNTWDNTFNTGAPGAPSPWTGTYVSQWPTAQNCHRLADDHSTTSRGAGWNTVTPW